LLTFAACHIGVEVRPVNTDLPLHQARWVAICATSIAALTATASVAVAHPTADARLAAIERQLDDVRATPALYLQRAEANWRAGRWQDALADVNRALSLDPERDEAVLLRARIHRERGAPLQALADLESFLKRHPDSTAALELSARSLRDAGELAESAAAYDVLLAQLREARPDHYIERASVVAAAGDLDEALRGLDAGISRLGPVASLQLAAVDLELRRRNSDAAVTRLDLLLQRSPRQAFWLARRAEILEQAGREEDARQTFESALAALPARRPPSVVELEDRIRSGLRRIESGRVQTSSTRNLGEDRR
jgi:tetratricopeptide (TPR) repeat protein